MPNDIKTRPSPSMTSPTQVGKTLDKIKNAIDEVKTQKGTVNVAKLNSAIRELDEKGLPEALRTIEDKFAKKVTHYVTTCGGRERRTRKEVPDELSKAQVTTVLKALTEAKKKAKAIDANEDGHITEKEYYDAKPFKGGFAAKLAGNVSYAKIQDYEWMMDQWHDTLCESRESVEGRKELETDIKAVCAFHAKTKTGAEALAWAFRDIATQGKELTRGDVDSVLTRAETSGRPRLVRMMTRTWARGAKERGHLNTTEIKELLGTRNLTKYVTDMKATIKKRVGGDYSRSYLAGKDLPGVGTKEYKEMLDDIASASTGC